MRPWISSMRRLWHKKMGGYSPETLLAGWSIWEVTIKTGETINASRWWFQTLFYFHPEVWGRWTHFDEHIVSDGLKPPTRLRWNLKMNWTCWFSTCGIPSSRGAPFSGPMLVFRAVDLRLKVAGSSPYPTWKKMLKSNKFTSFSPIMQVNQLNMKRNNEWIRTNHHQGTWKISSTNGRPFCVIRIGRP